MKSVILNRNRGCGDMLVILIALVIAFSAILTFCAVTKP
jgi:hypothetical protein